MTPQRAAIVVVIGMLASMFGIPIAEFAIWPSLVDVNNIDQSVQNIRSNEGAFRFVTFAFFAGFVGDIIVAWALYFLLGPVSTALAGLAAGIRAVSAVVSIGAALNLFTAYRLLQTNALASVGPDHLNAQVLVLLSSFRYEWSLALVVFGIHLGLLGYLVYRSSYIPSLIGIALAIAGAGYLVTNLQPYLYPDAEVGLALAAAAGEVIFLLWLAIWGWRIPESPRSDVSSPPGVPGGREGASG